MSHPIGRFITAAVLVAFTASGTLSASAEQATKSPINVGLIASKTGFLGTYGLEFSEGFRVGLAYATNGTGIVNGHRILVSESDDGSDSAKGVATMKDLIGQHDHIIVAGTASGEALQLAPIAKENDVIYISGAAAVDAITGINRNTFRAGRETYQDVVAIGSIIGSDLRNKSLLVLAQDTAFGHGNEAVARALLGNEGAAVSGIFVSTAVTDFTPYAQKVLDAKPDGLFLAWAGATGGALFKSLGDAGVFDSIKTVSGMAETYTDPLYGDAATKINWIAHYTWQCDKNKPNEFLIAFLKKNDNKVPEIFDNDGFVAAQMVVHAIATADGDDVEKGIAALEGWSFLGPKGQMTIRAADHAMLQPMFIVHVVKNGSTYSRVVVRTLPPQMLAPPVKAFK